MVYLPYPIKILIAFWQTNQFIEKYTGLPAIIQAATIALKKIDTISPQVFHKKLAFPTCFFSAAGILYVLLALIKFEC